MAKAGAKSKYDTCVKPYLAEINKKVREGVVEADIAKALGISVASLNNYKKDHAELRDALSKDKGTEELEALVNAGIMAAKGYYKENETTVISLDENGHPAKRQKTITKTWYPPNPILNKFYVSNFGKDQGFTSDPLEYELKKARMDFDQAEAKAKNWDLDYDAED